MTFYQRTGLLVGVIFSWLFWCSSGLAQVETLSEEEYRQEIQTYLTTPCFEEVGNIMKKTMKNLKPVPLTGVKLLRFIDPEGFEKLENKLTDNFWKNLKASLIKISEYSSISWQDFIVLME